MICPVCCTIGGIKEHMDGTLECVRCGATKEKERGMLFHLEADAFFRADNIDDALAKISKHFADPEKSDLFVPVSRISVEKVGMDNAERGHDQEDKNSLHKG